MHHWWFGFRSMLVAIVMTAACTDGSSRPSTTSTLQADPTPMSPAESAQVADQTPPTMSQAGARANPASAPPHWGIMRDIAEGQGRSEHHAVWTGQEMIVIGGDDASSIGGTGSSSLRLVDGGAAYDPSTDTWRELAATDLFGRRVDFSVVWTGREILIWGGTTKRVSGPVRREYLNTGLRYEPSTDTWRPMAEAPLTGRALHQAVWTGSEMLIWGGMGGAADGARYDPVLDRWAMLPTEGAPPFCWGHAIWTGRDMLLWPGLGSKEDICRFDPRADRWSTSSMPELLRREKWQGTNQLAWTGNELLVLREWTPPMSSGDEREKTPMAGFRVDLDRGAAIPMSTDGAPVNRSGPATVWTGSEWVVWGGTRGGAFGAWFITPDGGRYDPKRDVWTPIPEESWLSPNAPLFGHSAVWTGREVLLWGGKCCRGSPQIRGHGPDRFWFSASPAGGFRYGPL
jgi:hypothetical protein